MYVLFLKKPVERGLMKTTFDMTAGSKQGTAQLKVNSVIQFA